MDTFRKSATAELNKLGSELSLTFAKFLSVNKPSTLWQTCATCHHSRRTGPMFCGKFNMVPPVAIIVGDKMCEAYSDDREIPY